MLYYYWCSEPTSSPNENWNQLRDVLRSYFPQLDTSLNINKCCHGELFELSVASALSVGALIAQDFSKSSTSPEHELSGRLKLLCDYRGPEVRRYKNFALEEYRKSKSVFNLDHEILEQCLKLISVLFMVLSLRRWTL